MWWTRPEWGGLFLFVCFECVIGILAGQEAPSGRLETCEQRGVVFLCAQHTVQRCGGQQPSIKGYGDTVFTGAVWVGLIV